MLNEAEPEKTGAEIIDDLYIAAIELIEVLETINPEPETPEYNLLKNMRATVSEYEAGRARRTT